MTLTLVVDASAYVMMTKHCDAQAGLDRGGGVEACGYLLANRDARVVEALPMSNVADHPRFRYEMDPEEQLTALNAAEARGLSAVAVYHSHLINSAEMSPTDMRYAAPGLLQVVYSLRDREACAWEVMMSGNGIQYPLKVPLRLEWSHDGKNLEQMT